MLSIKGDGMGRNGEGGIGTELSRDKRQKFGQRLQF